MQKRKQLSVLEWCKRVKEQGCRTISGRFLPLEGAEAWEYVCTALEFLSEDSYLVKFTTPDGSVLVPYDHPSATPILIREFIRNEEFVQPILQRWKAEGRTPVNAADLLVQRCSSCDRRVVIDGVHRIVWIAAKGSLSAELRVSELSGVRWPANMPDMNVVCNCLRSNRR